MLLCKYFPQGQVKIIVTDIAPILPNIRSSFSLNDRPETESRLWIRELNWGKFGSQGIDDLVFQVDQQWHCNIDWIIGSDTFYDPAGRQIFCAPACHHHSVLNCLLLQILKSYLSLLRLSYIGTTKMQSLSLLIKRGGWFNQKLV